MSEGNSQHLAARLSSEGHKTREFFSNLPSDAWERCIYSEGASWTIRQLLAHLVGAEAGMTELLRAILAGGEGSPADFDLDGYNQRRVERMQRMTPDELLQAFSDRREVSAALVAELTPDDLERTGRHPWLGNASVEEIVKLLYRHNQIHQRDIRKFLAAE